MRNIIRTHSSHIVFITIMLLQLAAFVRIQLLPAMQAPPGHVAIKNRDDLYYISEILQIKHGGWTYTEPHTTRPIIPVVVHGLYTFGGKLAGIFDSDPAQMYVMLRIIGSLLASVATYICIIKILPKHLHTLGVLFTFCLETIPLYTDVLTKPFSLWTAAVSNRVVLAQQFPGAHHSFGIACAITIFIIVLTKKRLSPGMILVVFLLSVVGTICIPSILAVFLLSLFIPYAVILYVRTRDLTRVLPIAASTIGMALVSAWMKHEFAKGQPLNTFYNFENGWFPDTTILKLYAQSALVYIPWIAVYVAAGKRKAVKTNYPFIPLLLLIWIALPPVFIFIKPHVPLDFLPVANWRIAWGVPTLPFAILATLGAETLRKLTVKIPAMFNVLIVSVFSLSLLLSLQFIKNIQASENFQNNPQMYLNVSIWKSIGFLNTIPQLSGILTAPYYGEIIPAYARVRTFIGEPLTYVDWQERNWLSYNFFSEKMSVVEAASFLKDNDISYVFFGPEEQSYHNTNSALYPSLLYPVKEFPGVIIYSVIQQ